MKHYEWKIPEEGWRNGKNFFSQFLSMSLALAMLCRYDLGHSWYDLASALIMAQLAWKEHYTNDILNAPRPRYQFRNPWTYLMNDPRWRNLS